MNVSVVGFVAKGSEVFAEHNGSAICLVGGIAFEGGEAKGVVKGNVGGNFLKAENVCSFVKVVEDGGLDVVHVFGSVMSCYL